MIWRAIGWGAGIALVVLASVFLLQQVAVGDAGTGMGCGSSFDVVAGRVGWSDWWAADVAQAAPGERPAFVRSRDCPAALNRRMFVSGGLLVAGVAVVIGFEAVRAQRSRGATPAARPAADRVRRLGATVTASGVVLAVAGVAAIVLLVADPRSTLFLYVDRPVVILFGLLLLQPAIAMVLVGRALSLAAAPARDAERDGPDDAS